MKTTVKFLLIGFGAVAVLVLATLPITLPPLVQSQAENKLAALGFPSIVRLNLGYAWNAGPELSGTLSLRLLHSPVEAVATFDVGLGTWHAHLKVPPTELSETDPTVHKLLATYSLPRDVSNLTFRATFSLDASAERTHHTPVPVWSAKAPLRIASLSLVRENLPIAIDELSVTPGASGIADRLDISPMFLRIAAADIKGCTLTNFTASVRATEKALLVTEAKAGICSGTASLYSLFLDPKTLNAGFTLFMDNVDAGEILSHFNGFHGEASGRLHGKLRLFVKEGGKALRLSDAFLYSIPGEIGKLKMSDSSIVTDKLALAGINEDYRQNIANALTDLDYSILKLNLRRGTGRTATLGIRLTGTATRDKLSVPVDLDINFNGDIEQIANTGLGFSERLKGKN